MKLVSGFINILSTRFRAISWRFFVYKHRQQVIHLLIYFLLFTGLIVFSQLLSDDLSQQTVNTMCWAIVCAVAALVLVNLIKVLEGVLDS